MLPDRFTRLSPLALWLACASAPLPGSLESTAAAEEACACDTSSRTEESPRPLVIVAEGYDSCQDRDSDPRSVPLEGLTSPRLTALSDALTVSPGVKPHIFFACFGPPNSGRPSPWQVVDLRMQDRDDFDTYAAQSFDSPFQQELRSDITHQRIPAPLRAWFDLISAAGKHGQPLYLIGHGYGAWAAMEAVHLANVTPRLLVTIDAISPLGCGPSEVLGQSPNVPLGCKRPPEDLSISDYNDIAAHTVYWLNVFQTQFTRLHSGAVAGSNYNWILRPMTVVQPVDTPNNDHYELSRDERIWSWITATIKADYSL